VLGRNLLLTVLPQLLTLEIALWDALSSGRTTEAVRVLIQWRHVAAQSERLVRRNRPGSVALADTLVEAIVVVSQADNVLEQAPGAGASSIGEALELIARATSAASAEIVEMQGYARTDERE
jgi:hypothetical protein